MKKTNKFAKFAIVAAASLLSAGALTSCSSENASEPTEGEESADWGKLNMNLTIAPGYNVDSIHWVINTNPAGATPVQVADTDVSATQATATASTRLAPGSYNVALTATATGGAPCAGNQNFTVTAGSTVPVSVALTCHAPTTPPTGRADLNATFQFDSTACGLTQMFVGPLQTEIGEPVTTFGVATAGVTFSWTDPSGKGHFASTSASNTQFFCDSAGAADVTLTVSNPAINCTDTKDVQVTCVTSAVCGDGVVGPGEQCETTGASADPNCNPVGCRLFECGNGTREGTEQCDDSNTVAGDGCTATCRTETCGDGIINNNGTETCDPPGSAVPGGTCSATCQAPVVQTCPVCTASATGCATQNTACNDAANGTKCTTALSCVSTSGCAVAGDPTNCVCGTDGADPLDCAGGSANGDCLTQFRAAASNTASPATVLNTLLRLTDTDYPLGDAVALLSCQYSGACAASCASLYP
ncbi:MAG TPA: hypothetical protein VHM70_00615 [Polyangiaceae bacterium]|nr:hypothetical protein [Polyangiaceae bacterium]